MATWDRRIDALDWLAVAPTIALAALTIWAASYPVPGTDAYIVGGIAWSLAGILWSVTLVAQARDTRARVAAILLLVGALMANPLVGLFFFVFVFVGSVGLIAALAIGALLLGVVIMSSRPRRLAWLIAPAVVVGTLALMYSGAPRLARMALAERELTEFAGRVDPSATAEFPVYFDDPVVVGSIPVYEAFVADGRVHLVTGYVGLLADYPAGIAYAPRAALGNDPRYQHMVGDWYRWLPD